MNPERFGHRLRTALKERNARAVLRLLRLALREGDRQYNFDFDWRLMTLVPLVSAAFFGLSVFAGEAWAWAAIAIVVLVYVLVLIPRRVRQTIDDIRRAKEPSER